MLSQEAKGLLLEQPDLFITHYFPERIKKLEPFHLRLVRTATTEKRGLILYPAFHGKTTLVSTLLPIHRICQDANVRIGIIGKNENEANNIMLSMQAEMTVNTRLLDDFGPFEPGPGENKPWALGQMSVHHRTLIAKEPTVAAFGSGSRQVLGHRTNWTICDDVITEKNSATPEQRGKIREWFNQSVRTMGLPGARLTVVGTLFDPADLYNDLCELTNPETGAPLWQVQREDAIVEICECGHPRVDHHLFEAGCVGCGCGEFALDEAAKQTLWPDWWPYPSLMELKAEMGTLDFNKRLRNIAVDKSRMVFKEEYVKGGYIGKTQYDGCLDRNYNVGEYDPGWKRVAGFDPAVGTGRTAKFCAHITLGLGSCPKHEKCLWVIDLRRDQLSLPQQVDVLLSLHQEHELFRTVVEVNSYQAGLFQSVKQRMDELGLAFLIDPHHTTKTNKPDPELGVQSMQRWFENGWVHIPWGNPESQRKMNVLVDELIQYPGRTTDTVMAFWFAWKNLQEAAPKYQSGNYLRRPGSAWSTLGKKRRTVRNPYYARAED